jgi:PKD repeat protein
VNVDDCCVVADFSYTPLDPDSGEAITFNASTSSSNCDSSCCGIISYEWDWDASGGIDFTDSTGVTAYHTYSSAGTYTVNLRVTDDCGNTDIVNKEVVVTPL